MTPRIVYSPLSKRWFITTRYAKKHGIGLDGRRHFYVVSSVKHDVTDQMETILKADRKQRRRR